MNVKRFASVFAVVLLLVSVVGMPAVAGVVSAQDTTTTTTTAPTPTTTENNTTTTTTTSASAPEDTVDGDVRLYAVSQDAEWLTNQRNDPGNYSITGPTAQFESREPLDHVNVSEPGADARIVGDHVIIVDFDADAAPPGEESRYTMDVVSMDGTEDTVTMMVSETDVDVGVSDIQEHRPIVLQMLQDAEDSGYERSPEGLQNYYDSLLDTKELYDSMYVEQALRFVSTLIALALNPIAILTALLGVIALVLWLVRQHGDMVRSLTEDNGRYERLKRELRQRFRADTRTAASTRLRDVEGIGTMGEVYWNDAYGVTTIYELGELALGNLPVQYTEDGDIKRIGGVGDLDASNIDSSWLEKVTRSGRLATPEVALDHLRTAVDKLETHHGMGYRYGDVYSEIERLMDELDETHHADYPHQGGDD